MSRRPLAAFAALSLTTLPALAQEADAPPRPSLWDVLTVETLATSLAQTLIGSARAFADIRYDQISVDPMSARIDVIGLRIDPQLSRGAAQCRITAAQATLRGGSLDRITSGRASLVLDDLSVSNSCLPPELAVLAAPLGQTEIRADRISADLTYDYPSGGGMIQVNAEFDNLAALQVHADLDYISYRMDPNTGQPALALDVNALQIGVTDLGAWAIAQNILSPEMTRPEMRAQIASDAMRQILREANGYTDPDLSARQNAFAEAVGQAAAGFGHAAPQLVLASTIAKPPLRLDPDRMRDFKTIFDRLSPSVGTSAPQLASILPVAQLETALGADTTAPQDALAIGRALITGRGAPQNLEEGLRLLHPLAEAGNADAAALAATALEDHDPVLAYDYALRAGATGAPGALALLNRLERDLGYGTMMAAQDTARHGQEPDPSLYGDARAMRDAMRGYFTGTERPRSYALAYYWALIGAAAGDPASLALRADLSEMMRLRGNSAQWRETAAELENAALRQWIDSDVPAALRGAE